MMIDWTDVLRRADWYCSKIRPFASQLEFQAILELSRLLTYGTTELPPRTRGAALACYQEIWADLSERLFRSYLRGDSDLFK